jgi:hypothetical protein
MTEVRRCGRCGAAAAVSVRDWQETAFLGLMRTGRVPRRDFVCQSCGTGFKLRHERSRLIVALLAGAPMTLIALLAVVGGVIELATEGSYGALGFAAFMVPFAALLLTWCAWPWWVARTNPVVPDAPMPIVRFTLAEPPRRCRCGTLVPCARVSRDRLGTEAHYDCESCGARFVVDSTASTIAVTLTSVFVAGLGAALLATAGKQGTGAWVVASGVTLLGVGGLGLAGVRVVARIMHPVVRPGAVSQRR